MAKKKPVTRPASLAELASAGYRFDPTLETATAAEEEQAEPTGAMRRVLQDGGISLLKGAIGVPEAAVGLADLATGGRAGKVAEGLGFRPAEAKAALDELYTPETKAAIQKVQQAEGFLGKVGAAVENPSVIGTAVAESVPMMGAGGVVGRGLTAAAPRMSALMAGAAGEGVVGAGMAAEQVRQQTADGLLTPEQSALAGLSGVGTAAFGLAGGKVAKRLGIGDVDTMLAQGSRATGQAAALEATKKGMVRKFLEGAVSEGVLEELPQSMQEQVLQNAALGRPLDEGVDQAAALGLLSGMAMGGPAGALGSGGASAQAEQVRAEKLPEGGPMSRAVNAGIETTAKDIERGAAVPGLTAEQENDALSRMEAVMSSDLKGLKVYGRGYEPPPTLPGRAPATAPDAAAPEGSAQVVDSPFADRVLDLNGALRDPTTRAAIEAKFGKEGYGEALYYLNLADQPQDHLPAAERMPERTRDRLLQISEAIVSQALLQPLDGQAQSGARFTPPANPALPGPAGQPLIGLDTEPTGTIRVDGQGNAAPETRADAISTRQRADEAEVLGAGVARKPRPAPAPTRMAALENRPTPTGVIRVDGEGTAKAETVGDAIQTRNRAEEAELLGRQAPRATAASTPAPVPAPTRMAALANNPTPSGRLVAGQDGVRVETMAEVQARRRQAEADAEMGLTPDVRRAQQQRKGTDDGDADSTARGSGGGSAGGNADAGRSGNAGGRAADGAVAAVPGGNERAAGQGGAGNVATGGDDGALTADRWDKAPRAERERLLGAAGWAMGEKRGRNTEALLSRAWDKMSDSQRARIGAAMESTNAAAPQSAAEAAAGQAAAPAADRAAAAGEQRAAPGIPAAGRAGVETDGVADNADLSPDSFAGSIKAEIEARARKTSAQQVKRGAKPAAPAAQAPEPADQERYRVTADGKGGFTLESDESILAGNGDGSPRRFQSETAARKWAAENGYSVDAPDGDGPKAERAIDRIKRVQAEKAGNVATPAGDETAPHIKGIHGWWGVGGTAGQADSLTAVGRAAALQAIGISNAQAGYGKPGDMTKVYWTYLKDDVRSKLAALRRDGWTPDAKAPETKAAADVDDELNDALGHLGDVLGDVFGAKKNITGPQHTAGDLLPAISKVVQLLVAKGFRSFTASVGRAAQAMRGNPKTAPFVDKISARQWKAAYNAIADSYDGTDDEAAVAALTAEDVAAAVAGNTPTPPDGTGKDGDPTLTAPPAGKEAQDDSTDTGRPAASNQPVAEGQRPEGVQAPERKRGARQPRATGGRRDAGGLPGSRGLFDEPADAVEGVGDGAGAAEVQHGQAGAVAADGGRASATDFRPQLGGLKREGSWLETAARNIDLIELAIKIEGENRPATPDEQAQLSKYVGFGAGEIRNALFPVPNAYAKQADPDRLIWPNLIYSAPWKALAERMERLPREWQKTVLQSTQYAHYTSEPMVRAIWSAVQRMGFTGGKVFEPGMGIGNFAMLMPDAVRASSRYTGIEFDGPTATIAKLLSPQQNVMHDDFIKRRMPRDYFDLAIGNPPFSATKIVADPAYAKHGFMLHDYFFAKSLDQVRPGGLLVFVTSKGTMDKKTDKARKYLADRADLVGAIRLPSTAFEGNAGTSVVTDVIVLRKRQPGEAPAGERWADIKGVTTKDGDVFINEYFADHPEMVLGQHRISGNVDDAGRRINSNGFGGERYTVVSYDRDPAELDAKFAAAIERLPENVYSLAAASPATVKTETAKVDFDPKIKREGVIYTGADGTLLRVTEGVGKPLADMAKLTAKDQEWLKSYVGLRELVQEARHAQYTDGDWQAALKKLNKGYDAFVKKHGPVNAFRTMTRKSTNEEGETVETEIRVFTNRRLLREDYDAAIVTQLETIDESGEVKKNAFLLGRTIGKPVTREVRTVGDALAVSLDEMGALDLDDVARRLHISRDEAIEGLGAAVFRTPQGEWQLADEYLSGNVVQKLDEAIEAARADESLKRNVEALKEVQPEKLGPSQIAVKLGASWVSEAIVNDFAKEIEAGAVTFDPKTESWQVDGGNLRSQRRAGAEYGTAARSPSELLEAALNSRPVKIMTRTADKKEVVDQEATTAANEAVKKIKDKFRSWVWTDTERAAELVERYNRDYNNIAPRRFNGDHLTLPGVSPRFKLHAHQLRAIWRQIQTGNTYLAHAVGAGKTIEMIAGGMEQKRLGLIKKPMYVVPNHMLEQFATEFLELYPLANVMVADDDNFSAERRKNFIAAATLNAPDAIVITHDAFLRIGVSEESVGPIRDEILADLEMELSDLAKDSGARVRRSQLEQQIEAVTQRFDRILAAGGKDATIKFEDMGVDHLTVDEAHAYRKLDFHTAQTIKGIDPNGSKRALDMYVKTRYLDRQRPGRSFTFASGTPVTNTMGELYTLQRFFQPDVLAEMGASSFDAWSRMFGEVASALEPNASGKYEMVERFSKFDNVPELMSRVRMFMDVLTSDHLGSVVTRPDLEGGKPNLIVVPPTKGVVEYQETVLAQRLAVSRAWKPSKDQPSNPDPVIAIITDGRFAGADPRFTGRKPEAGETTKLDAMAERIISEYHATADNTYTDKAGNIMPLKGGTQIVFYNLGFGEASMRSRGFNARQELTRRLVEGGVKRDEIAWFDDANTDAKKGAVFKAMRAGQYRILVGSAKKMGTGVNVQNRLSMLHYFDPPWYPSDVEQPHGRIIRQGNQNKSVRINWYATKGGYDSTMWQMVGRKQRFIDQAFSGDKNLRTMDDLGEASQFEQAAALSSGDPRAIQLAGLRQDVERLERLQAAHASEQIRVKTALSSAQWEVDSANDRIKTYTRVVEALGGGYVTFQAAKLGAVELTKPGEFGEALKKAFNAGATDAVMQEKPEPRELGTLNGNVKLSMEPEIEQRKVGGEFRAMPTGRHELFATAGGYTMHITTAEAMGADVDAVGLARRVMNALNAVDGSLKDAKRRLTEGEADIRRLRKKMGAPFEHQQDMLEKFGELKELEEQLRQEGIAAAAAAASAANPVEQAAQEVREGAQDTDRPAASRSDAAPAAHMTVDEVRAAVERLTAGWANAPRVEVIEGMDDPKVPQAVRDEDDGQSSRDAAGEPEGFFFKGVAYLHAGHMRSEADVRRVLFHEALGHFGLRGLYGNALVPILDQIIKARQQQVRAKAREYGLDANDKADLYAAAEEVLAEMAQSRPDLGFVKRAIAAVRAWLRSVGLNLRLTDDDIVAQFLLPARRFVEQAGRGGAGDGKAAFSRAAATTTAAFRNWFGASKIANADGSPKVMYHGTAQDISTFKAKQAGAIFVTDDPEFAGEFAVRSEFYRLSREDNPDASQNIMPVYVKAERPFDFADKAARAAVLDKMTNTAPKGWASVDGDRALGDAIAAGEWGAIERDDVQAAIKAAGFDSFYVMEGGRKNLAVYDSAQLKSATGNRGTFDASSGDIRFSRSKVASAMREHVNSARSFALPAGYIADDFITTHAKLGFWQKTVGTPYNLAKKNPSFRRVFDAVQSFLGDVSSYATEAADLAPRILPKLETLADLKKSPLSPADTEALGRPVFEGTLLWRRDENGEPVRVDEGGEGPAGIVWDASELRSMFGLTEPQIALYREFRAATNESLRSLTVSEMVRVGGKDIEGLRDELMRLAPDAAARKIAEALAQLASTSAAPARLAALQATGERVQKLASRYDELTAQGYAPLSRFGTHTLDVVDANGARVYFGLFESTSEANRMARQMRAAHPGAQVTQGTLSQEAYKQFAGVSPETVALFGDLLGLDEQGDTAKDAVFQEYLKRAKSTRSAMRRLIHRKGIAGFSEDAGRVLAGFIYSNARSTSANLHQGEIGEAVQAIPKGQGELADYALKMAEYTRNPQEEAQRLKSIMFAQFLGGSIASALVNMTQPIAVTFPYLSQFGGTAAAAKQLTQAMKDNLARDTGDAALNAALKRAEEEGIVSPQEVFHLMAQAQGSGALKAGDGTKLGNAAATASNAMSKLSLAWGKLFSVAEQFNRRVTFIAAYRMAPAGTDPAKFAAEAVTETQFTYNKGNKPQWARGMLGSLLFTFKQYSINYVELLARMANSGPEGRKAALLAIAVLALMGGADELPFLKDAQDVVDGLMQRLGYNFNSENARNRFLAELIGKDAARFVAKGVSGLPGAPIDISGRLGMGNLIPGTGVFLKRADYTNDVLEIAGPAAKLGQNAFKAAGALVEGRPGEAVHALLPIAAQNAVKGVDMAMTGEYRDTKGRKVIDTTAGEALAKAIGFQPESVARVQAASRDVMRTVELVKQEKAEIQADWAQGLADGDRDAVEGARQRLADWNRNNPEAPIRVSTRDIRKKVVTLRQDRATRLEQAAPKAIRADVKNQLAEATGG